MVLYLALNEPATSTNTEEMTKESHGVLSFTNFFIHALLCLFSTR